MPLSHAIPSLALGAGSTLSERYLAVRQLSEAIVAPLAPEDTVVQSMPDVSPTKWHLAHVTWFFERFVLAAESGYAPVDDRWDYLFNSYYESAGARHPRVARGLLSRPTLAEVQAYRRAVDDRILRALDTGDLRAEQLETIELGLHHEQQHQELMLADIKHVLWCNPLAPVYRARSRVSSATHDAMPQTWIDGVSGIVEMGAAAEGFAFDCERPRHRTLLQPHRLASRPVSNADYRAFVEDGGYRNPLLWLSQGWATVQAQQWSAPLYWHPDLESVFTLHGDEALEPDAPVCHLSYFEADAFARWAGARLPTEAEWECAAERAMPGAAPDDRVYDLDRLQPEAAQPRSGFAGLFGGVWEWTASPYVGYPGYRVPDGALGEYNGKFMCGQFVLRGGSCVTPPGHLRASYRNFFYPADRWQFSGLRLARDL